MHLGFPDIPLIGACRENPDGVHVVDINLDSSVENMTAYLGFANGLELQSKLLDTAASQPC